MSNFKTMGLVSNAIPGTGPSIYVASTADSLGTITASGYLNDLGDKVKLNDQFFINYADTSVQPVGGGNANAASTFGNFRVVVSGANVSLSAIGGSATNLLQAAFSSPDVAADLVSFDVTATHTGLATNGDVTLIASSGAKQYRLRVLQLNSGGTNFSGGGGDRLGQVTDGGTVYSVVPAATMQSLVNAQWGVTALPNPASAAIFTPTVAGVNLIFKYSGGTTDYTAGSLRISGIAERIA